jgi:NifB/MoaA-like Fe-S oxidoreductase
VCTGKVFYPYLKECVDRLGGDLKVTAVESRFWGPGIGVAGLLTGSDFIDALRGNVHGDFVVLPSESMIGDDGLFLDDLTVKDIERELGVEVIPSGYSAAEFVREMSNRKRGGTVRP